MTASFLVGLLAGGGGGVFGGRDGKIRWRWRRRSGAAQQGAGQRSSQQRGDRDSQGGPHAGDITVREHIGREVAYPRDQRRGNAIGPCRDLTAADLQA